MAAALHTAVVSDDCVRVELICIGADRVRIFGQRGVQLVAEVVDGVVTLPSRSAVASEVVASVLVVEVCEVVPLIVEPVLAGDAIESDGVRSSD